MENGLLVVISGFSGAGKGTITKKLIENYDYYLSTSATTRKPREGEVDGKDYFFKTKEEFKEMIDNDGLIEWAEYVGNYYGTPKKSVEEQLAQGKDVILEIEVQGGMLVKKQFPDAVLIFITPPSIDELKNRLVGRGTESEEEIQNRLKQAAKEVKYMREYEFAIINDDLEESVSRINDIIKYCHNKTCNSPLLINQLENELANI